MKRTFTILGICGAFAASTLSVSAQSKPVTFSEPYEFDPPHYVCYRTPVDKITIDGDIDGPEWAGVPWTRDFIDIQGKNRPETPRHRCRAKLMWDNNYLYIAAELEEPHLWATYTQRESVIFHENDFEVFLDVTGTTHNYMEFEVNALGTEWDLMLTKPYRDGGAPLNAWNMNGMTSAVKLFGTLNDPSDTDQRWTFEMAIPLSTLCEVKHGRGVRNGEQWRLNFSRVQWQLDVQNGKYVKKPNTPEDNWVWAPTGKINIHEPEYWGYLQFSTTKAGTQNTAKDDFVWNRNEEVKWALRKLYFRQREFGHHNKRWATTPEELKASEIRINGLELKPVIYISGDSFKIVAPGFDGTSWAITSDGYISRGQ